MPHTSYYDSLEVSQDADAKGIRLAYLKLAAVWHPDKNDSLEAHDRFVEISEAYQVLSDPEKRDIYNRFGREGLSNAGGEQTMTRERALQQFWEFFRPVSYRKGETASAKHGAYVASVGAFTAPLKGLAVTVTVTGAGFVYGADTVRLGFTDGAKEIVSGSKRLRSSQPRPENEDSSAIGTIAVGLVLPFVGIVKGACLVTGATVAGVSFGLAGGLGGAAMNLKEGGGEWLEATSHSLRNPEAPANTDRAMLILMDAETTVA